MCTVCVNVAGEVAHNRRVLFFFVSHEGLLEKVALLSLELCSSLCSAPEIINS